MKNYEEIEKNDLLEQILEIIDIQIEYSVCCLDCAIETLIEQYLESDIPTVNVEKIKEYLGEEVIDKLEDYVHLLIGISSVRDDLNELIEDGIN